MKYEISNIGKLAGVIRQLADLIDYWTLNLVQDDGTTDIAYSIFHISNLNGEYK